MTRFVKWPLYVRLQRRKATLMRRLKIPPPLNQFRRNLLKRQGCIQLFRFLDKYRPETRQAKKERLRKIAKAKAAGKNPPPQKRPPTIVHGKYLSISSTRNNLSNTRLFLTLSRNQQDHSSGRKKEGTSCCYRRRHRPNRIGYSPSCPLQKDGSPLLHHQRRSISPRSIGPSSFG